MTETTAKQKNETGVLVAQQLANDPRLAEARQLILDVVNEHRDKVAEIREADPQLTESYQAMLDAFGKLRGGNLYFPYLSSGIGNGPFVELADGSVKLDFITGIGVHGFGHSDPRLVDAGIEAALCDTVMQGNLQQNTHSVDTVRLFVETARESGAALDHCFMTTSGAMANENALKMAFQKNHPASRIIAFEHCFAGRTLALTQVTDKAAYRHQIPKTIDVDFIPFFDADNPEESTQRSLQVLRRHFTRHPGRYAALWMEVVQGEGGYYPGSREFFKALIQECRQHDMAIIVDEIQSFCRTSRPFAFQHFELDEDVDIVTVGKISQVCATLYREEYKPQPGLISQTFTGSSWAIIAARTILQGLIDGGNFGVDGKNQKFHDQFARRLEAIGKAHPGAIRGPYGVGGMIAFTPFDGSMKKAKELVGHLYDAGLMSFIAGGNPTRVRFLIPLGSVTEAHIELAGDIVERVISQMHSA